MNLNEVIANLGNLAAGSELGSGKPIHPNNHVNRSQSSNDTFPTVMHISALRRCRTQLLPKLDTLLNTLETKQEQFRDKIKIGRTHLMDATPITLGQEIGAWRTQLAFAGAQIGQALDGIRELAIGATAVGTGINTRSQWADLVVAEINAACGFDFVPGSNKFAQLSGHEALLNLHQQLNLLAAAIFKMANDIRLMNSGPRCGLAEISIPANEPGSSIMPGKINPTQAEALTMVCCRVMGNNTTVAMCASQGQFQLNAYKPVIIHCVLESLQLLGDAILSFEAHCLRGLQGNDDRLEYYTQRSLMLVTALSPTVGYDEAATAAKLAQDRDITLREAVLELQLMSAEEFDRIVDPAKMLGPAAE